MIWDGKIWDGMWISAVFLGAAALVFVWRWSRRAPASGDAAYEAEIETLRDEIWELRAAAAARDKAEAASIAKSRFLATVSHEIRTPLNGILGLAQLLGMTRLDAEQSSYVEAIGDCSRSLAQLIDDILDFSKIEAGKLELRRETFALAPLVESVVELLAPRAQNKNLEIASHIAADAPTQLLGDPARLRQVLVNLVGNAVNFTSSGGVGVRVITDSSAASLRFEIEDTGPGVPAAAREMIFEEFEQADLSATRRQGGTGLGLAISRRLVAAMGGSLELVRTSPSGATFAFGLPLSAPIRLRREAPFRLQDQRVLIVARSVFEAPYLAEILRSAGALAEIANGEAEGLAFLVNEKRQRYDAIIVDCALGETATVRLAQAARSSPAGRVFLLFSPLERRAFDEAALGNFDGWLVKPVRAASLIERLSPGAANAPKALMHGFEPTLAGRSILICEDNDVNALIVSRHLTKLGAKVTRAENGQVALHFACEALDGVLPAFDLILMDLFMPELDGLEATRRIRVAEARLGGRRTPILALTASAHEDDERAARAAGVDALLTKPVEFEALAKAIGALRDSAPGQSDSAPARLERRRVEAAAATS